MSAGYVNLTVLSQRAGQTVIFKNNCSSVLMHHAMGGTEVGRRGTSLEGLSHFRARLGFHNS